MWRDPRKLVSLENLAWFLFIILILVALYGTSVYDYLLFHGIVEIFTIIIAFTIFFLVWNNRKIINDAFFLIIGISFLFTGIIDLFHTFAYQGMGVFPGSTADLPTQLWIAARYFQSVAILVATFFIGRTITKDRKYDVSIIFAICIAASGLLLASIFVWHDFPQCFVAGTGLTQFKIVSEYVISLILIATALILYIKRRFFDPEVWQFLIAAQLFLVAGELAFTTYVSVYGFTNMLGHLFKFIAFYLFYRAIVVVGISRPYDLLFRDLVENINDVIYTMDNRGKITYISPAVKRLYGYDPADVRGRDFASFVHPDDQPVFEEWFGQRKPGTIGKNEFRILAVDGSERYIRATACPVVRGGMASGFTCTLTDITDLKRAETAVRDSYQILNTVLNTVTVRVFWKDEHLVYLGCNKPFARDAGFEKPEDIIGKDDFAMAWRDQAELYQADDRIVIESGISKLLYEEPQTTPSGDTIYLLSSKVPLRDASGNIIGVLGTYLDITEKKIAEEGRLESEARLRSILHSSPVMQLVIDQDHRVISWNKAIEIYSGIRAEDIVGTDGHWRAFYRERRPILADIVLDGTFYRTRGEFSDALIKSPVVEDGYETTDFFPDMGEGGKWLHATAVPIHDAKGAVIGTIETIEDITERKRAESALKESEEKYRSLIEYSPYGVLLTGPDGSIVSANASACMLLGWTEEEMKMLNRSSIVDPNDPRVAQANAEREKQGTAVAREMTFIRKDGSRLEAEVSSAVFLDRNGEPLASVIFSDITERKRMENALQLARTKINILNTITFQDIQSATFSIAAYNELLQNLVTETNAKAFLGKQMAVNKKIINALNFAKNYQEMGAKPPSWQNVGQVFLLAISHLDFLEIKRNFHAENLEIYADPLLERVFFHLMQNVIKPGRNATEVTVTYLEKPDGLVLVIEDNGTGIPPEEKHQIFDRGYSKDFGLGFSLAKEVLSITGMTIAETGVMWRGVRFEIHVPKEGYRFSQPRRSVTPAGTTKP